MRDIAVRFRNVSKYYKLYDSPRDRLKEALHPFGRKFHREFYALNDISFEVRKGEVLGVVGKNGSGKSTLLKLISQVLVPNKGIVQVDGSISALIELGAGFNPEFTGMENIYFYGTILGFTRREMDAKLDGIVEFADIGEFIHQPIKTYSSGMRARLAFAVATEVDPEILIVDEALSVGDTVFRRKCFARINTLFKAGRTVILVSHSRNAIVGLCEKALLLDRGRLLSAGDAESVMREYEKLCYKQFLVTGKNAGKEDKAGGTAARKEGKAARPTSEEALTWDPALLETEPVHYAKSDIEFKSFGIYDLDDNKVNILRPGATCRVRATFLPKQDLDDDVMYAMRIRTLQGYMMAWMGYPFAKKQYLEVRKDKLLEVEYLFDCNFHKGVFYVDAGLQSYRNNELFLHVSINNVYAFRLDGEPSQNLNGEVHLNFRSASSDPP